jgi:PAS domain S-box-containing protein
MTPDQQHPDSTNARVLHVGDADGLASAVASLERREGLGVEVVAEPDTREGLWRVRNERVDCVVSAVDGPGVDGLSLLGDVRDHDPTMPFVLYADGTDGSSGSDGSDGTVTADEGVAGVTEYVRTGGERGHEVLAAGVETALERARDPTGDHDREDELERYRTIVESTGDPVYTLDAAGRITYVNEAFESMTGYDAGALVGEHMSLLVPAADVAASEELIRDLLDDPERTNDTVELDIVRADGSRVRCENHIALLPYDETFQGTAGAIRDITARRERKRELEAQNERLDRFASVVSHDLRNPLNVAQGHLELARERVEGGDESLARVGEALDRMDSLVADVLALAREGESVTDPARVSLADVALMAWASVDTPAARLEVDTDTTVLADGERLRRLFENLFRNSVEHGSTSSRPRAGDSVEHGHTDGRSATADGAVGAADELTVRVGTLGDGGPSGTRGFFVEDDGSGIDPDDRDRVFETGYSTDAEGTGFGLDIVRSICSAHGWEVGLGDGDLGGARFEFHLPDGSPSA